MALVLAKAAAFDGRTIGDADIEAWHECIGQLGFDAAMAKVTEHFRQSRERLMPADLMPAARTDEDMWAARRKALRQRSRDE